MATISERVHMLDATLKAFVEFRDAAQRAEKFIERVQQVAELRERLGRALANVVVLKANSAQLTAAESAPIQRLPATEKARDALRIVVSKLEEAPMSLNEGKDFSTFRRRLEVCASGVEEAVTKALDQVEQASPSVDESFLKQVENIVSYESIVREIRMRRDEFKAVKLKSATPDVLQSFLDKRTALRASVDALTPDDFPASVIAFFKATRKTNGASLDLLTEEVRVWLVKRDLLKKVRVTVSS